MNTPTSIARRTLSACKSRSANVRVHRYPRLNSRLHIAPKVWHAVVQINQCEPAPGTP